MSRKWMIVGAGVLIFGTGYAMARLTATKPQPRQAGQQVVEKQQDSGNLQSTEKQQPGKAGEKEATGSPMLTVESSAIGMSTPTAPRTRNVSRSLSRSITDAFEAPSTSETDRAMC